MKRILVIDDDPIISAEIQACVEAHRFEIVAAAGADAGLSAIGRSEFDLMIVDNFVPKLDGFEPLRVFRHHAPRLPLIVIFGREHLFDRTAAAAFLHLAIELGAMRCLRKPFTRAALLAAVAACVHDGLSGMSWLDALARQ
jgi:DNA-binding response OmpR family regulator